MIPEKIIRLDDFTLAIEWVDKLKQKFNLRKLRAACTCAGCQNEWTGERQIQIDQIKPSIAPVKIKNTGQYAMNIEWNDSHSSGIYTYEYLRKIGEEWIG